MKQLLLKGIKYILVLPLFLLFITGALAQGFTVQGKVTDENDVGLPGVTVLLKGTTIGTATNIDGSFSLSVPDESETLVVSFIGYQTQEVPINNRATINVSLAPDAKALEEVVVVGYGTQRKRDLTGSISQVEPSEVNVVATPNVTEALQGRTAGVSVLSSAEPGGSPTVRVRGTGSISAGNDPLIVVDGFPLVNANLSDINSNDIASIEVLKDASATAIYGSRGANGVIIVTTKQGTAGQKSISVNSYYGIQTPARLVETLNREEFIDFINAAYINQTGQPVYTDANPAPMYDTDWQDVVFRDYAPVQSHTISLSGGSADTKYMLSGGYFSQDGLLSEQSGFRRYTVRSNLDHKFNDRIKIGSHLQVSQSVRNRDTVNMTPANLFRYGWPTTPVRNPDGSYYYASQDPQHSSYIGGMWNPEAEAGAVTDEITRNRILGDIYAEISLGKHLSLRSNFGADLYSSKNNFYANRMSWVGRDVGGRGRQNNITGQTLINENILTYSNLWNDHNLTVNGVYSYQKFQGTYFQLEGTNFPTDITNADNMQLAGQVQPPISDKYSSTLVSFTSRASYSYKGKYLLTLTGRYDGSSRFGANNKWGFFPSVGAGWNIIDESFMQDLPVLANLKLRASYGQTGNQEIGNYQSLAMLNQTNYVFNNEYIQGFVESLGNPDLKWERSGQLNVGLDLGIINNRINMTVDYYRIKTTDLIYNVPIPTSSGFASMLQNIGAVENKGFEFSLDARVIDKSVKWDLSGNATINKNQVLELYGNVQEINLGSNEHGISRYLRVGEPLNGLWGREFDGIIKDEAEVEAVKDVQPFAEPGDERYIDQNGDGLINQEDDILIGTTEPNFFYGLSTNLQYKNFSFEIFGQGATGIAVPFTDYLIFGEYQLDNRNYIPSRYVYERMWRDDNPGGTFPAPGANEGYQSDRSNGNRNYFIVKNIRLGYTIDPELFNAKWFKNLNVYVNAQNYISFANFRGWNPETGNMQFPLAKSLMLGVNANF